MKAVLVKRTDETTAKTVDLGEEDAAVKLLEVITAMLGEDDALYAMGFVDDALKGTVGAPSIKEHKQEYLRMFRMWLHQMKETAAIWVRIENEHGMSVVVWK